jgi:hypothetical protein
VIITLTPLTSETAEALKSVESFLRVSQKSLNKNVMKTTTTYVGAYIPIPMYVGNHGYRYVPIAKRLKDLIFKCYVDKKIVMTRSECIIEKRQPFPP